MKRYFLSKRDIKGINEKFPSAGLSKGDSVEYVSDGEMEIALVNGTVGFFYKDRDGNGNGIYPALKFVHGKEALFKKIVVDMGAVKFVCSGADVMRPGVRSIDDGISKDDVVIVVDERHGKALAVGVALFGFEEMKRMSVGKVIKNLHWVGDQIWNYKMD